jgi:hypothetical protein
MTTYTAPRETADAAEARTDWFDAYMPQWREMTEPDRFVSEADMPLAPLNSVERVSDEDWQGMTEALWSDPAERDY